MYYSSVCIRIAKSPLYCCRKHLFLFVVFCFPQYAAKEYQQALDILDMEEPASKKLLDKPIKEDNGIKDSTKEWEMSPASVSHTQSALYGLITLCGDSMLPVRRLTMTLCQGHYGAFQVAKK